MAPSLNSRPFLKGLGLAAVLMIPIVVFAATTGADPEAAGEWAGNLSVAPLLAGLAVGAWARFAPRRWNSLDYILRFALCTIAFFAANALGRVAIRAAAPADLVEGTPLTDAEKEGLSLSGGWLRHSQFGFVLPLDTRFEPVPEVQEELNRRLVDLPGAFIWALRHPEGHQLLFVLVAKGAGDDNEAAFRAMARGVRRGIADQAADVLEDDVEWGRRVKEFRYAAQLLAGAYVKARCVPSDAERPQPYIICVQTLAADSNALDASRQHLKVAAWR